MYASHLGTKLSKEPLPRSSADGGARRAEPQRPASQRRKAAPELHCEGLRDLRGLPRHPVLAARPGA